MGSKISRRQFIETLGAVAFSAAIVPKRTSSILFSMNLDQRIDLISQNPEFEAIIRPNNLPVYLLPLRSDFFYKREESIKQLILGQENRFGIRGLYSFDINNTWVTATTLPNVTGSEKALPIAILNEVREWDFFSSRWYYTIPNSHFFGEYTMMTEFYPNKIINLLLESISLLEYQERENGFEAGKEHSMLEIVKPWTKYLRRRTSSGFEVPGGGVCGGATTLAKALYIAGAEFIEKHPHHKPYWIGPINPQGLTKSNSDATIQTNSKGIDYDFKWIMPDTHERYYLDICASVLPNNKPIIKDGMGEHGDADARIILNFAWTTQKPEDKILYLRSLIQGYKEYRNTNQIPDILKQSRQKRESIDFGTGNDVEHMAYVIYTDERTSRFTTELSEDQYISEIKTLADLVNKYSEETTSDQFWNGKVPGIGTYLKETDWYVNYSESPNSKNRIDRALQFLDVLSTYRVREQALQCVGWIVLLAHLGYKECPRNIGGIRGDAADMVPPEIKDRTYNIKHSYGLAFHRHPKSVNEFEVGDLFFDYQTNAGHVGAIIGKKTIDDEVVLLAADANRRNKGEVAIFEVDKSNLEATIGGEYSALAK